MSDNKTHLFGDTRAHQEVQAALEIALGELDGQREANRQAVALLTTMQAQIEAGDELASAVDAFFDARHSVPDEVESARYRLSQALVAYRAARKARSE